jgi:DNA recombination protein RmuC
MGFQTLAIEARTSELWDVLSAMKDEFDSFTTELASLKKQLGTAVGTIEKTEKRTGKMRNKLRDVEERPLDPSELSPAKV